MSAGFGGRTYSADGLVLRVEPLRTEHSDGSTGYSLGFQFAELSDIIGDSNDIADKLAEYLSCPKRAAAHALYEALVEAEKLLFELCPKLPHDGPRSREELEEYERIGFPLSKASAALKQTRGDLVDPLEQVRA